MDMNRTNRGFALPVALFALVVVGIMVTGGFFLARQESRISVAGNNADQALSLAERGIEEVRLDWIQRKYNGLNLWQDTTITGTTNQGDWEVVVTRTDTTNYFAQSTGTVTRGGAVLSGASRRVGLLLRVKFPELEPPAALATSGPLEAEGQSDVLGTDQSPAGWGGSCQGSDDKPGALMQDLGQLSQGGQADFEGDPPTDEDATMTSESLLTFGELDYDDLIGFADKVYTGDTEITGTAPDSLSSAGGWECDVDVQNNWGDPENAGATCYDYFPTIHVQGDLTLNSSSSGQGILLVDGDITLQGGYEFYGIVIVKGALLTEGQGGHVNGGLIVANEDNTQSRAAGSSVIQYSSCAAARAIRNSQGASKPKPLTYRSWVDLTSISY